VCFYHLVSAGRGGEISGKILSSDQTRKVMDTIIDRTSRFRESGREVEILTVDNHADGPYLYMRILREDPEKAAEVLKLLEHAGGNRSGKAISCISWDGQVHPDQFWRNHVLGNIRQRPFSEIWTDPEVELLTQLRNREKHLQCRCTHCRFLPACNGNLRARSEAAGNGMWGDDPGCYLTDEEIAK